MLRSIYKWRHNKGVGSERCGMSFMSVLQNCQQIGLICIFAHLFSPNTSYLSINVDNLIKIYNVWI